MSTTPHPDEPAPTTGDDHDTTAIAAGVYGTIIAASVLAAAQLQPIRAIIALLVVTLVVYWLSEQYAHTLAHSIVGHRPDVRSFMAGLRRRAPMLQASYIPVLVLIVSYVLGLARATAILAALVSCVVVLFTLGWVGGTRRGLHVRGRLLSATIASSFGLVMIVLKLAVK